MVIEPCAIGPVTYERKLAFTPHVSDPAPGVGVAGAAIGGNSTSHWAEVSATSARPKMVDAFGLVRVFQTMTSYCVALSSWAVGAPKVTVKAPSAIVSATGAPTVPEP